ncbi:hypothetical protein [Bradyrhizobium sp. S69]|uniref:hypothetical protein n=1 Tax=Bradyrhizobium sp. S69 TaxID=1641856 RepID=UPI00131EAB85|nr:hypothetical protein [Bradyrhizobium sp. S69]
MTRKLSQLRAALLCLIAGSFLAGCSVAPNISNPDGVPVRDVVQRIKCELNTAISTPLQKAKEDENLAWFKTWTAKIDLTLAVSDLAQINPTGSTVSPLQNAYPNVGPSALGGTAIAAAAQKFTFGFNAAATGQRTRTEDISFTLSMEELEKTPAKDCERLLQSQSADSLGFNEWIDTRVFSLVLPDKNGEVILAEGQHSQGAAKGTPAKLSDPVKLTLPKGGVAAGAQFKGEIVPPSALEDIIHWIDDVEQNKEVVVKAERDVEKNKAKCPASFRNNADGVIPDYNEFALHVLLFRTTLDDDLTDHSLLEAIDKRIPQLKRQSGIKLPNPLPTTTAKTEYSSAKAAAEKLHELALKVKSDHDMCTIAATGKKNPPIDLTTYTTQFVITFNLGLSPTWTFVRLTGPSGTTPLASLSRADTHTISVILAPSAAGPDVQNQRFINALRSLPVAIPAGSGL